MSTLPHGKLLAADAYAEAYSNDQGFEAVCIAARQARNAEFLNTERPSTILEVGCGPELLCTMPAVAALGFSVWAIVEPATAYASKAAAATAGDRRFRVIQDYIEVAGEALRAAAPHGFDAAIVSGLVHETTDPAALLAATRRLLRPGGKILVSAPNAGSFHRLLAVECGMISAPHQLSEADRRLGHPVVFDPQSLGALVASAGFEEIRGDGYLFKPFTNAQMQKMLEICGPHLIEGLISLGRRFPQNAAEICVTAAKPQANLEENRRGGAQGA